MADNKKLNKVVGLKYELGGELPKVILKGSGRVAEDILRARRLGSRTQVVQNDELVDKLFRLPVDADISDDLFELVAIVLAHVLSVNEIQEGVNDG